MLEGLSGVQTLSQLCVLIFNFKFQVFIVSCVLSNTWKCCVLSNTGKFLCHSCRGGDRSMGDNILRQCSISVTINMQKIGNT